MSAFTNTEACIIWIIAVGEIIFTFVYMIMQNSALRRKIVSMGRMISSTNVVIIIDGNQRYTAVPPAPSIPQVVTVPPTAPPSTDFYQPQNENPPSYSSVMSDKKH